jgi:hypothetical protein
MDGARIQEHESHQAIADHLVSPPSASRRQRSPTGQRGWTGVVHTGDRGGEGADRATIHFAKTKVFPSCQLHQVRYIDWAGRSMNLLVRTWQGDDGEWRVAPCGGGGSDHPRRSRPWVNFAAGFGPGAFTGGGSVVGDGAEQASLVRLTFANAVVIEDAVEGGVVLYFEPRRVTTPATVDILDADGMSLARYEEFGGLADG